MSPDVLVVGAGAFGGWTALELVGRGARVTLVDAWGPGHVRSSSGGETRVIRASYGSRDRYSRLASRAFERWRRAEADWRLGVFRQTGGLWMFGEDDRFGRASAAALEAEGLPFEWLTPAEAARRFPQIAMTGLSSVMFEPEAGYLLARRSCELVLERFLALGGVYRQRAVASPAVLETAPGGRVRVRMSDASAVEADAAVFACGPWLGALFPDVVGGAVTPTRQESYCFGTPPGDPRFTDEQLPVWLELRDRLIYGVPGNAYRGFKIADDSSGPAFDPTSGSRELDRTGIARARARLAERFPDLRDAPFVGGEVCQYEATPDSDFIIAAHPAAANAWIAGGGSGHGFKMGPVVGEIVAEAVLGHTAPDPAFRLGRFERTGVIPTLAEKWR
jgi:glycine/D-amino acid oxidase-like deaminating enzyme